MGNQRQNRGFFISGNGKESRKRSVPVVPPGAGVFVPHTHHGVFCSVLGPRAQGCQPPCYAAVRPAPAVTSKARVERGAFPFTFGETPE